MGFVFFTRNGIAFPGRKTRKSWKDFWAISFGSSNSTVIARGKYSQQRILPADVKANIAFRLTVNRKDPFELPTGGGAGATHEGGTAQSWTVTFAVASSAFHFRWLCWFFLSPPELGSEKKTQDEGRKQAGLRNLSPPEDDNENISSHFTLKIMYKMASVLFFPFLFRVDTRIFQKARARFGASFLFFFSLAFPVVEKNGGN